MRASPAKPGGLPFGLVTGNSKKDSTSILSARIIGFLNPKLTADGWLCSNVIYPDRVEGCRSENRGCSLVYALLLAMKKTYLLTFRGIFMQ